MRAATSARTLIRSTALGVAILTAVSPAGAQVVRQVTDFRTSVAGPGALDDAGSVVLAGTSADVVGDNPDHRFQIFRFDAATGSATRITQAPDGASAIVSVSDDGEWIAFVSSDDLAGRNHDQSPELYAMRTDGSQVVQLTDDPAVNAGSVSQAVLSGDATRAAFVANTDPLGTNPDHLAQLFVVDRDGSNLTQLTQTSDGSFGRIGIGDGGTRVVFAHDADLVGGNADLGSEIFAIDADGTNLRQLTTTPDGFGSTLPSLSGNGQVVAFQTDADLVGGNPDNQDEIFVVQWDGTGLAQVTETRAVFGFTGDPAAQFPSITDDGSRIFFHSNHNTIFVNFDGNFEIFSVGSDGTGLDQVTATFLEAGSFVPTVSGDGSRIGYFGIGDVVRLHAATSTGANVLDLVEFDVILNQQPDVSPDGGRAVFVQATGLFGGDQIWKVETDGSGLSQVTNLGSGSASSPSIAADRDTIVFSAGSNPNPPDNDDGSEEIFRIRADGTGLSQLTFGAADTTSRNPVIAADASVVVFDSDADLTAQNVDGSREIFAVNPDGTGVVQLTSGPADTTSRLPRVDAAGVWVAFESNADLDAGNPDGSYEVYRVRTDGSLLERITGDPVHDSRAPDLSGAGDRVVFQSSGDPLGTNPEENSEIFVWEATGGSLLQATSYVEGTSGGARIGGNGEWIYFSSSAPITEEDPDRPTDLYRVRGAGGDVERVGALRRGVLGGLPVPLDSGGTSLAVEDSGAIGVASGFGDLTEANPDLLAELWVVDRLASPVLSVSPASPTVVSWTHGSGPLRYDVIRGSVASLALGAGVSDLGDVVCLEDDSPDADTAGFGDPVDPEVGQAFFYVYRGTEGLLAGPGSYGTASTGAEREPSSGGCAPQ